MQLTGWPVDLCQELVAQGYRVVKYDNRDIGLSTKFNAAGKPDFVAVVQAAMAAKPSARAHWQCAGLAQDRSGDRRLADRTQPGIHRRLEARHSDEVRIGAARLHPGGHPGAEADPVRSAKHQVFMTAIGATWWWLNEHLQARLGEKNAADTLTQSVPHNVTSEMGLALLDVADVIRPHPEVVALLQHVKDDLFLDELPKLAGGQKARDAIRGWLDKYGMRCVGEIDITRPRWSEHPTTLVPSSSAHQELRARSLQAALRARAAGGMEEGTGVAGALADLAGRGVEGRRGQADDRPGPDLQRVPGVSEVWHGRPLFRLQEGLAERSRALRAGTRAS
jgi:hypothetical protein